MPESSKYSRLTAALGIATALASTVVACGPEGGGGTPTNYAIVFALSLSSEDLTALTFTVTYTGGNFVGEDTAVECSRVDGAGDSATFTDDDSNELKVVMAAATNKLVEDDDLVECQFHALTQPTANNFTITVDSFLPADSEDVTVVVTSTEVSSSASLGEVTE